MHNTVKQELQKVTYIFFIVSICHFQVSTFCGNPHLHQRNKLKLVKSMTCAKRKKCEMRNVMPQTFIVLSNEHDKRN